MQDLAIHALDISKKYIIGHKVSRRLRDSLVNIFPSKSSTEEFWALKNINLEVKAGDALGIIGKNGAGKSTLLKIFSRITEPTTGRFEITGRVSSLLEVGTGFHPELTGRENVFLNGTILGMKRTEVRKKFDEIVEFAGVEKFIDTPVKRYSSGMYVRLAFSVAAHLEPEVMIIDEVLAVGDAEFQKKCLGKMEQVSKSGRTVIFVSHNMQAIQELCSACMVLQEGKMIFLGTTDQAIKIYNESKSREWYERALPAVPGKPYVKKAWITDMNGHTTDTIDQGNPFALNFEIINPLKEELEIQLTFWDGLGVLLWNFTHQYFHLPPLPPAPAISASYQFYPPEINASEIFIHFGLSQKNLSFYGLTDHVVNALSIINRKKYDVGENTRGVFRCPVKLIINTPDEKIHQ